MLEIFMKTIGNVRDEAAVWIVKPIEIFIQLFPQEAGYFDPIYQKVLSEVFALTVSYTGNLNTNMYRILPRG